jgi:hypothetical protein
MCCSKQPIKAEEVITNDLIGEINAFDPAKLAAEAQAYTYGAR